ncbi:class II aminoacyl-tRNA and biotin synthetases superfamily protein [Artemisia annua]|uniref:Class II aminoacyl-tRNA and biotin synthetases superfamily protein n=1 Tax=Artemisia annua TaxID=35608 RepID=A0A2U1KKQ9_ARTAN|nr:class II aminoacyl-tRNA and biotin synthetases superfamily protein [Artemisia annua]
MEIMGAIEAAASNVGATKQLKRGESALWVYAAVAEEREGSQKAPPDTHGVMLPNAAFASGSQYSTTWLAKTENTYIHSGKSTLPNHLFHTNFTEMNAENRRHGNHGVEISIVWKFQITQSQPIEVLEEAVSKGHKFENKVEWGIDLASEHERYLKENKF